MLLTQRRIGRVQGTTLYAYARTVDMPSKLYGL